jgi:hypothetical protein
MRQRNRTLFSLFALLRRHRRVYKVAVIYVPAGLATVLIVWLLAYAYNNISLMSDLTFVRRLDSAIEKSHNWIKLNKKKIIDEKNIALIRMLQDIDTMHADPLCSDIVKSFMAAPARPDCWKRLLDADWPVINSALNRAIDEECLDNKWTLYAIAPECANITPEEIKLYDPDRWRNRKLTHQLWALTHLRQRQGPDDKLDSLIEHLCDRIAGSQRFDLAVVDIYLQKTAFVLQAGFPEKVRRRWVERIIANQRSDGGWNDKWFVFTSETRRPSLGRSASNQHATAQAFWLLSQVKHRYAEQFGAAE